MSAKEEAHLSLILLKVSKSFEWLNELNYMNMSMVLLYITHSNMTCRIPVVYLFVSLWVCGTNVVHHLNGKELR